MKEIKKTKETIFTSLFGERTKEKSAGLCFSLASVLPTVLVIILLLVGAPFGLFSEGYEEKDWYLYCNFLIPQLAYAIVIVFFFLFYKLPFREISGNTSWGYFLIAILLQFGLFSLSQANDWFLGVLQKLGYTDTPIQLPSLDGIGFFSVLFTVAILPAVFEELLFRGVVLKGVKGFGALGSVLLCGGLFSVFHLNPAQTVYQFCCGMAYALLALRSGSVFPTMLAHFLNNAFVLFSVRFSLVLPDFLALPIFVLSALCLTAVVLYLAFFDKKQTPKKEPSKGLQFLLCASAGILICVVSWFVRLLGGM